MNSPDAIPPGNSSDPAPTVTVSVERRTGAVVVLHVAGENREAALATLNELVNRSRSTRKKPWWKFW